MTTREIWELIMRFSPAAIALSLLFATTSSVTLGQTSEAQVKARSMEYLALGNGAQNGGQLDLARDYYETALAVDPRNGKAFIALAKVARLQGLQGTAFRFYKEALILDPNDLDALAGQGEALLERGAFEKAKTNLARIDSLCRSSCPQLAQLSAAIAAKEKSPLLSAQAVTPKPTVEDKAAASTP
jgi:tetratricopeptide (TPR) repeat protein